MLVKEFLCVLLYYDFQDTYFTGPSIDRGIRVFVSHPGGVDRVTRGDDLELGEGVFWGNNP